MDKKSYPPSPSPRSTEKSGREFRSGEANGSTNTNSNTVSKGDKEKGVNVHVILRCRWRGLSCSSLKVPSNFVFVVTMCDFIHSGP